MEFTTHFGLNSQTARLVECVPYTDTGGARTGLSPSVTRCSNASSPRRAAGCASVDYNSIGEGRQTDFQVELLPLHSQLLRESLLVSFPPLINMLKFSGSSYLISGPIVDVRVATNTKAGGGGVPPLDTQTRQEGSPRGGGVPKPTATRSTSRAGSSLGRVAAAAARAHHSRCPRTPTSHTTTPGEPTRGRRALPHPPGGGGARRQPARHDAPLGSSKHRVTTGPGRQIRSRAHTRHRPRTSGDQPHAAGRPILHGSRLPEGCYRH